MEKLCRDVTFSATGTAQIDAIAANGIQTLKLFIDGNSTATSFALSVKGGGADFANETLECCACNDILSEPVKSIIAKQDYEIDVDGYDYVVISVDSISGGNLRLRAKGLSD